MKLIAYQKNKGFALLLALIVSSVVLAIGISILNISVKQINLSSTARESELAFQAAHAGVDCIWYWRNTNGVAYSAVGGAAPAVNCFEVDATAETPNNLVSDTTDSHARSFSYLLEWGTPTRCTDIEMVVMNAHDEELELTFQNQAVGNDGEKTCLEGNVCTVIFSRGYNRACDELDSNVFTVQRELTVEF